MNLRFQKNKPFKLVQFTDVHYADGGEADARTLRAMRSVLQNERPDLVVLTGDTVNGEKGREPKELITQALAPVIEAQVPWAFLFGNHDTQWGQTTKEDIYEVIREQPYCVNKPRESGVEDRYDFALSILKADGDDPAWDVYCFDSGRTVNIHAHECWSGIHPDQTEWYVKRSNRRRFCYGHVPALAFMHIPLPEHLDVWDRSVCRGVKYEGVGAIDVNTGFFYAAIRQGDIKGIFAGHDHVNDYTGDLYGVQVGYGRISGYNTYPGWHNVETLKDYGLDVGARVFLLNEGESGFTTYIAEQDGTVIYEQPVHRPANIFGTGEPR